MGRFFKHLFITLAAFIVATLLFLIAIVGGIVATITILTPEVEPLKRGTVLEINMNEAIIDAPQSPSLLDLQGWVFGATPKTSTLSMLKVLEAAATDPNITAISLRLDGLEFIPLTTAEELRVALEVFSATSEKPIYAYGESYSQVEYYLATAAKRIFIHPLGQIEWQGVAMNTMFYGDLISHIGAKVEVFRPKSCNFKSAVEPYTRGSMSSDSREQSLRLVDVLWDGIVGQVSLARTISEEQLRRVARDRIVVEADESKQLGMVDEVAYEDLYIKTLEEAGIVVDDDGKMRRVTLANYASRMESGDFLDMGGDKIAVIYVDGTIVDGESESSGGAEKLVGSATIVNQLRKARYDDDIKGVVLRVNSPGGSAMAADVMWREVELLKQQKMVVVSMGSYAASGGYYISAPADAILADRYTLTGSIGVFGMMVDCEEAISRHLRINIDGVGSSPSADFGRTPRAITPLERAAMMRSVDQIYDTFTEKVSLGRNLPIGVVNVLAGGRVWSGIEAESCGLVDGIGGLKDALNLVVDRCDLSGKEYQIIEINDSENEFDMLFKSLGVSLKGSFLGGLADQYFTRATNELQLFDSSNGIMMLISERLSR